MNKATTHCALLISPDTTSTYLVSQALPPGVTLEVSASVEDAVRSITQKSPSIVLCMASLFEGVCARLGRSGAPDVPMGKWAILCPGKVEDELRTALAHGIYNVFPQSVLMNKDMGFLLLENLIHPEGCFGLRGYLKPPRMLFSQEIRTGGDKREAIEKAVNYFATCGYEVHELYNARLVLEEMVNNSLFHAFVNDRGEEKYQARLHGQVSHFDRLAPGERIDVEFGNDSESIGFAVTDNGGRIEPMTVVEKLARQYNREGIYDESGRGIYLMRMFSNLLVINIEKHKRTQLVAIFGPTRLNGQAPQDAAKPLCVNYFE
jgi:hypothetical protein